MKRYVSKIIETKVSKMIIGGEISYGDTIVIDYDNDYIFNVKKM